MTDNRIPPPKFGATVTNRGASIHNPHRTGYFVRSGTRTGRMNRGPWWEITDGRGDFWQLSPIPGQYVLPEDMPHLIVDRSTELPTPASPREPVVAS